MPCQSCWQKKNGDNLSPPMTTEKNGLAQKTNAVLPVNGSVPKNQTASDRKKLERNVWSVGAKISCLPQHRMLPQPGVFYSCSRRFFSTVCYVTVRRGGCCCSGERDRVINEALGLQPTRKKQRLLSNIVGLTVDCGRGASSGVVNMKCWNCAGSLFF